MAEGTPQPPLRLGGSGKPVNPTGLPLVDGLADLPAVTLADYVAAVSEYVRSSGRLSVNAKKTAQLQLSSALGQVLVNALRARLPGLKATVGERQVAGALRVVRADVCEYHQLDGLRLAVEVKPVNLAVGRALWNRFGDIRAFAVNLHLKFPFAVVGGVLVIPTYEVTATGSRKPTTHLIERTVNRLVRTGRRRNEFDAPHLLEGIAVVVYDPETGELDARTPPKGSGLRWEEFTQTLVEAYDTRFGEGSAASSTEPADADASD